MQLPTLAKDDLQDGLKEHKTIHVPPTGVGECGIEKVQTLFST